MRGLFSHIDFDLLVPAAALFGLLVGVASAAIAEWIRTR